MVNVFYVHYIPATDTDKDQMLVLLLQFETVAYQSLYRIEACEYLRLQTVTEIYGGLIAFRFEINHLRQGYFE